MELYDVINKLREIEDKDVLGSNTLGNLKDLGIAESEELEEKDCGCGCSPDKPCECGPDCSCGCNAVKESSDIERPEEFIITFTKGKFGARNNHSVHIEANSEDEAIAIARQQFMEPGYRISNIKMIGGGSYALEEGAEGITTERMHSIILNHGGTVEDLEHWVQARIRFRKLDKGVQADRDEQERRDNGQIQWNEESKKDINEASVTMSIDDLQSTDMETLSQMLHLAGVADQGSMGMGDVYSPADDMMGMDAPMDAPMSGDLMGPSDIDDMSMDAPMDEPMDMEPDFSSDDYEAGFDAEMGADDGMDMEPMDEPVVDMSPEDDAVVMGDYAEESLEDMLNLAGVEKIAEEDPMAWDNEPDERVRGEITSGGPNRPKTNREAAPEAVKVVERTKNLKAKLKMFKEA